MESPFHPLPLSRLSPFAFCFVFVAAGDDWIILFEICKSVCVWRGGGETSWHAECENSDRREVRNISSLPEVEPQFPSSEFEAGFWQDLNGNTRSAPWHFYCEICTDYKKKSLDRHVKKQ